MKTRKNLLIPICAVLLAGIAGCGSKDSKTAENADSPLTYWCKLETVHRTSVSTLGDIDYYKELQKRTGVEIQFVHPPAGQEQEQFNLMMSSRDYTDIIESDWTKRSGGAEKAIADKIIAPLNDIIDKSAPNYKKLLSENKNLEKAFSTDSGKIFAFGDVVLEPKITSGGLMIRRDWLKDLNMEMPETIAEWEKFFEALKNQKGLDSPFTTDKFRMENQMLFSNSFGIGPGFYVDGNRKVKYGPATEEYKEYLKLMNSWFQKGYLDNGIFSNTQNIAEAKVLNGESGAFYGFIGSVMGRLIPAATDKNFDIAAVMAPSLKEGEDRKLYTTLTLDTGEDYKYGFSTTANAAVTTKNKNPEKTAKLFDYLYSEEGNLLKNFGIEGETYEMKDSVPTYTDLIMHDPDGHPIADAMGKYFRATYPNPGFINDINYYNQYYVYPQQKEALETYKNENSYAVSSALPPISVSEEETNEISNTLNTIDTYKSEMFTKFIMGTESIDNFDTYLKNLKDMGLDRVLEIYNAALKRYDSK